MSDLIQRAAAICGYSLTPNSDQLAAWFPVDRVTIEIDFESGKGWSATVGYRTSSASKWHWPIVRSQPDLLHCLAAAVVEVDRIEREAKQP